MDQHASTSRYILTSLAVILVITAFILVALNAYQTQQGRGIRLGTPSGQTADQSYIQGYLAARSKYQAICPFAGGVAYTVTGAVEKVSSRTITLFQKSLDTDSLVDRVSDERTILLTPETVIQKQVPKSPEDISKEIQAQKDKGLAPPPLPYTIQRLSVADLQQGQTITVQSSSDVRLAPSITALTITLVQ